MEPVNIHGKTDEFTLLLGIFNKYGFGQHGVTGAHFALPFLLRFGWDGGSLDHLDTLLDLLPEEEVDVDCLHSHSQQTDTHEVPDVVQGGEGDDFLHNARLEQRDIHLGQRDTALNGRLAQLFEQVSMHWACLISRRSGRCVPLTALDSEYIRANIGIGIVHETCWSKTYVISQSHGKFHDFGNLDFRSSKKYLCIRICRLEIIITF